MHPHYAHGHAPLQCAAIQATHRNLPRVGVDEDLVDHQGDGALLVHADHGLADGGFFIAVPYLGYPVPLGDLGVGQELDDHVQHDLVDGSHLGQCLLVLLGAVIIDVLEGYALLLHVGHRGGPLVGSRTEGDAAPCHVQLPILLELGRCQVLDLVVKLGDYLDETLLHLLGGDLELVYQAVHLVDEDDRLDVLLDGLPDHGLGLGHDALHGAYHDHGAVQGAHGTGHVTAEVHVAGGVDEVDEVLVALELVHHRGVDRIDGDAAGLFLLVVVQGKLAARQFEAHEACACHQAVRQGRLAVVDVGHGADIPDVI